MIETTIINFLSSKLDVPVVMENITEKEYVLISKTGSGMTNHIKEATFAIQSYSDSLYNAAILNEKVKIAMLGDGSISYGLPELNEICNCYLNSDYEYSDKTTKEYRYQAVFDIKHY